jgi:hypothetical protein
LSVCLIFFLVTSAVYLGAPIKEEKYFCLEPKYLVQFVASPLGFEPDFI